MFKKKKVVITSLAMRFHEQDGWTREELEKYLSGTLVERRYGDLIDKPDPDGRYWILEVGSRFDVERMMADGIVEVVGKEDYAETRNVSDLNAMKLRNW